jgi:hypothetical protein
MASNQYNGAPADVDTVHSGTRLYRILRADATWKSNSFNMKPRTPGDPEQGRFEPTDPKLGGYIYVADTVAGAVAEGVLRNRKVPKSGVVHRSWLINKKIAVMRLDDEVEVAALYGGHTAKLDLDASMLCCGHRGYSRTRAAGTAILLNTPLAYGIRYRCRNHDEVKSLMLITRSDVPPRLVLEDEMDIFSDERGRELVLKTLNDEFGLKYTGKVPS